MRGRIADIAVAAAPAAAAAAAAADIAAAAAAEGHVAPPYPVFWELQYVGIHVVLEFRRRHPSND